MLPDQSIQYDHFKQLLASLTRAELPDLPEPTGEAAETGKIHKSFLGRTRTTFKRDPADPVDNEILSVGPAASFVSDLKRLKGLSPVRSSSATILSRTS